MNKNSSKTSSSSKKPLSNAKNIPEKKAPKIQKLIILQIQRLQKQYQHHQII